MFGARLIHSLTKGDAPMFEAGLIYPPSYMGDAPMLEAGLIYPPLKKGGRGDLPGRQGALWNLTKAKPSQIPLVPPFTKGDAPMLEAGLIYPPSYMVDAPMLEAGLIHPPLKKGGRGDLPSRNRCRMEFLHSRREYLPIQAIFELVY